MIADEGLAWPLTVWFTAVGILSLVAVARAVRWPDRLSFLVHLVMSADMATMAWNWSATVPSGVWIGAFGAAGAGYAALAISRPGVAVAPGVGHHANRFVPWYHVMMMLGMVWMHVLGGLLVPAIGIHADNGMQAMPGMPLGPAPAAGAVDASFWALPLWALAVTVVLAAALFVAAIWFLGRLRGSRPDPAGRPLPERLDIVFSAAMALGMAVGTFAMA